jgi:hypothetical protein
VAKRAGEGPERASDKSTREARLRAVPWRARASFPEDSDTAVWRYLTFAKFVALLEGRAVYFARSDRVDDPWEGSMPRANDQLRSDGAMEFAVTELKGVVPLSPQERRGWFRRTYLSCWSLGAGESVALWKSFAPGPDGVVIRSTVQTLATVFGNEAHDVLGGAVSYVDYGWDYIPDIDPVTPFYYKRLPFEYEREFRALIQLPKTGRSETETPLPGPVGLTVPVAVDQLIAEVRLSPWAAEWLLPMTKGLARRYEVTARVGPSELIGHPSY